MVPPLHLYLLGTFLLISGDTPVKTVTSPRLQSLLAYLVLHRDVPQDRSHLAFLLWPDSTEAQAHTNLRKLVHQLRKLLPGIDHFLHADTQSLQWLPDHDVSWSLDVMQLEEALAQAAQAEQAQDAAALRQALEYAQRLYRGDLLPGCYDEWILSERDRLRQRYFTSSERLLVLLEQERDYETAITVAQQLLRQDPLQEATARQLMRLYALKGDRAAALRVYHSLASLLERELGTEPVELTRVAYETLLQADLPSRVPTGSLSARQSAPPLLGRNAEWKSLQDAWRRAAGGQAHVVLLTGEAGLGKTRLAEEMEAWVSRQGFATASARCYATLGELAYAPLTSWLRSDALKSGFSILEGHTLTEIARLVPEAIAKRPELARPAALTEGWQRQAFFEALAHAVLNTDQPLLLLLDDVQWCDQETLHWLHYLLCFEPRARLLLVGTVRTEETSAAHPLFPFLAALQRDRLVTELSLVPLTRSETISLAEHITGETLPSAMSNTLYQETEGNPLFVIEMLRAGRIEQHDCTHPLLTHPASTLPPTIQTILSTRFAQLSPYARDIANVAAVIGHAFPFSILARASEQDEETVVQGLDELWQRRLVREQAGEIAETYDFSHDKLREYLYTSLSPTRRRLLHRRIADALQAVSTRDLNAVSGQIAAHYERGGLFAQAVPFYLRAGEAAFRIYANTEALHALEQAVALLDQHPHTSYEVAWETIAQIYAVLGDVFMAKGDHEHTLQAYERALQVIPQGAFLWQARLHCQIARAWNQVSNNPHDTSHVNAREAFGEAERMLRHVWEPENQVWRDQWIELHFAQLLPLRGTVEHMTATIEAMRPVVEQYGTGEQRKLLKEVEGLRNGIRDRYVFSEQAVASRRATLSAFLRTGDKSQIAIGHMSLGIVLLWVGHTDEAEEQLMIAFRLGEEIEITWLQTRCLTFLPFVYRRRGQVERVRHLLAQAQAIGATENNSIFSGHRAWIAWREGNLAEAETFAQQSMEQGQHQQTEMNPFLWVGLWPLLGVALKQEKLEAAVRHVRSMLDPSQQSPPEALKALLEQALRAWDAKEQEEARTLLQQSIQCAEQGGYL